MSGSASAAMSKEPGSDRTRGRASPLNVPQESLALEDGRVFVRDAGDRGFALGELAGKANPLRGAVRPGTEPGLESTAYFGPDRGSTASGVHAMLVEVDPETAM